MTGTAALRGPGWETKRRFAGSLGALRTKGAIAMMSQTQIHRVARQMQEQHGQAAIAKAAQLAVASESKGEDEDAREWRHIEAAMKMMRGPGQG
jgi:hypothetical protein